MSGSGVSETRIEPEQRQLLLSLLMQGSGADPDAWRLFWQEVVGRDVKGDDQGVEILVSVFDEGISQIAAEDLGDESVIGRWINEVIAVAKDSGVDQNELSERLLTRQLCKQLGQRDQGRPKACQTREKILSAALEVFSVKGYHGATVDEIAEHAGLGKGTVYRHFKSKKGLFSELVRSKVAELEQAVTGAIDSEAGVLEIIETYLRVYFSFFDRNRNLYKVLIQEQSDFGAEVRALYIGNILKKVPLLKKRIYQAARDGQLKQMDFQTVFYGVMGFIDGIMQKWLASDRRYSLVDEIPTVLHTIFYGFVNPKWSRLLGERQSS